MEPTVGLIRPFTGCTEFIACLYGRLQFFILAWQHCYTAPHSKTVKEIK
jgi:hypothetical protein